MPSALSVGGLRWALAVLAFVAILVPAPVAEAADAVTPATCIAANEQAGPLRHSGRLREARAKLRLCSAQSCPGAVRKDCIAGAAQAEADVPTVAFAVQDPDGNDLTAVKVSLDGESLAERLDGKALDVDPGEHLFRFESAGHPTVEKRLVIVEGEKNRRERVVMGEPKAVAPVVAPPVVVSPPAAVSNSRRTAGLALGGAGAGLVVAGVAAGLVAALEWSSAKTACGPSFPQACADGGTANADRSASVAAGLASDIGLGVGAVALVTGAALVLASPSPGRRGSSSAHVTLAPRMAPGTGGVVLGGVF